MGRFRALAVIATAALLVAACSGATPSPTATSSASPAAANDGPSWCDPTAQLVLDDPDGTQVVLPGEWDSDFLGLHYFLRQIGDCIWMNGYVLPGDRPTPFVTAFVGQLGSDFRIVGEFSDLNGEAVVGWNHGSVAYEIQFTDAGIVLVEDRSAEQPPGCVDSSLGSCPDPQTLTPAAD